MDVVSWWRRSWWKWGGVGCGAGAVSLLVALLYSTGVRYIKIRYAGAREKRRVYG